MAEPIVSELTQAVTGIAIPGIAADMKTVIFAAIGLLVLIKGLEIILGIFCKTNSADVEKSYNDIDGKMGWERDRAESIYQSKLRKHVSQGEDDC